MARKPQQAKVTPDQAQSAVTSGQGVSLAAGLIGELVMRMRGNSADAGTPTRGGNLDCTFVAIVVFLLFRSTEVLLKAKLGMARELFFKVHRLAKLYKGLPSEEQIRLETDWSKRQSANRVDANGDMREHTLRETLVYLDTLNLNEILYLWAEKDFDLELTESLLANNEGGVGILADVNVTVSDTAIEASNKEFIETSLATALAPFFESEAPRYIKDERTGLIIPWPPYKP